MERRGAEPSGALLLPQAGANVLSDHSLKITLLAATPVGLWWYIFLHVVPSQFKRWTVDYMESHDYGDLE